MLFCLVSLSYDKITDDLKEAHRFTSKCHFGIASRDRRESSLTRSKVHHVAGGMKAVSRVTDIPNSLLAFQVFVMMYERSMVLTYKGQRHKTRLLL